MAVISVSVIAFVRRQGISESTADPSGRLPVRRMRAKSSSEYRPIPVGVMFAAGFQSGGPPGILPPESVGPWQPVQPVARYSPYVAVGAGSTCVKCDFV